MEYSISNHGDVITIELKGEMTLTDEEKFRNLSAEATKMDGRTCVVDLSRMDFLDSAGLGLLLVMKELCEDVGKAVSLKIGSSPVREILEISEFDSLIPFED